MLQIAAMVLVCNALATRRADAEPGIDRVEAGRLCEQGAAAMARGDFSAALESFQHANEMYPSANTRYNVGVALFRLGRLAAAVDAFEEFLDAAPNAREDARAYASARLLDLAQQVAHLEIVVSPPESFLSLDGQRLGRVRASGVPVLPGEHKIEAEKPGYESIAERVDVTAGEQRRIALVLRSSHPVAMSAPVMAIPPLVQSPPRHSPAPAPIYRKWWFWTTLAGIAVVGVAVGTAVSLAPNDPPIPNNTDGNVAVTLH
jgi:hypothetical protein